MGVSFVFKILARMRKNRKGVEPSQGKREDRHDREELRNVHPIH
jgi:hypothetical protein